jgi:hypothetical protein
MGKRKGKGMTKIARLMVLMFAISGTAFAETPYKEVEAVIPEITNLVGQVVSVHGLINKLDKDGMSASTVIISLDGGLNCRISRDAFKNRKRSSEKTERVFVFKPVSTAGKNEIRIDYQGKQILIQGTDVIIRGTVKKEMNKYILDRAVIKGCSDSDAREGMDIQCGGPCTQGHFYYRTCKICQN